MPVSRTGGGARQQSFRQGAAAAREFWRVEDLEVVPQQDDVHEHEVEAVRAAEHLAEVAPSPVYDGRRRGNLLAYAVGRRVHEEACLVPVDPAGHALLDVRRRVRCGARTEVPGAGV